MLNIISGLIKFAFVAQLRKYNIRLDVKDNTYNRFSHMSLVFGKSTLLIEELYIKCLYFNILHRTWQTRLSLNNVQWCCSNKLKATIDTSDLEIEMKTRNNFSLHITLPSIAKIHIHLLNGELFIRVFLSDKNLCHLLPRVPAFSNFVNSFSNKSITVLFYFNNNVQTSTPQLSYKIINPYNINTQTFDPKSLKNSILSALKCRNHLSHIYHPYENIPPLVVNTIISCEDPTFFFHKGICKYALGQRVESLLTEHTFYGGGSTITQQVMKNAFFSGELSISRKVKEIVTAIIIENFFHLSKQDIIEIYLNMAEFGKNIFGIAAASNHYFNKNPEELNVYEILTLSYILPRPLFFEDALLLQTVQLRQNLQLHFQKFIPILLKRNIISTTQTLSTISGIQFRPPYGFLSLQL